LYGQTRRGWLGVRIQNVTEEIAESLGLDRAYGALVGLVNSTGPAQDAGVRAGDVIVEFDGKQVTSSRRFPLMVANTEIGRTVELVVFRGGEFVTLSVTIAQLELAELDNNENTQPALRQTDAGERIDTLGIRLTPLNRRVRQFYGIDETVDGLAIVGIEANTDNLQSGLQPGQVIVEINQRPVTTVFMFNAVIAEAIAMGRERVLLLVSNGQSEQALLTLPIINQ
ncbi:MAG: PDZ domain-containing protein, partial [Pseudomonadota bacterium]